MLNVNLLETFLIDQYLANISCCLSYARSHLSKTIRMSAHRTLVYNIRISQGSVATRLRCGENFNNNVIANCQQSVAVNELLKSSIFGKDIDKNSCTFFMDHAC